MKNIIALILFATIFVACKQNEESEPVVITDPEPKNEICISKYFISKGDTVFYPEKCFTPDSVYNLNDSVVVIEMTTDTTYNVSLFFYPNRTKNVLGFDAKNARIVNWMRVLIDKDSSWLSQQARHGEIILTDTTDQMYTGSFDGWAMFAEGSYYEQDTLIRVLGDFTEAI
jgi:hypothetical protein